MPKRKRGKQRRKHEARTITDATRPAAGEATHGPKQKSRRSKASTSKAIPRDIAKGKPTSDTLCARCAALDLDFIYSLKVKKDIGLHILSLKATLSELEDSLCHLCQLFASMAPQEPSDAGCYLRAFSARRVFTRLQAATFTQHDTTLLGVVRFKITDRSMRRLYKLGESLAVEKMEASLHLTGYLHSRKEDQSQEALLRVRLISPEDFDVEFAQDCIEYCEEHHTISCTPTRTPSLNSPFFRLIDCTTGNIVIPTSACNYATLSYVWAEAHQQPHTPRRTQRNKSLPCQFPRLISDCMLVTAKLGLKYLWVDKYCIDQDDPEAKRDQISQMDLIYANSKITIVAASNHTGPAGLPGISGICRRDQPNLQVLGHHLVSTLPNPKATVGRSKWLKRGWTFQEGLLSRRCLIFTEDQVTFECDGMHRSEALILPVEAMHDVSTRSFKPQIPPGPLRRRQPGSEPFDIMSYILDFRERELTFHTDKLKALEGVFHAFERGQHPVYQFMGVPIYPPIIGSSHDNRDVDRKAEERLAFALSWYHLRPGERDSHFPSWSWAGWTGGDLAEPSLLNWRRNGGLGHFKVWIETDTTQQDHLKPFPKEDNLQHLSSLATSTHTFIYVEAICIPCSIEYFPFLQHRTDEQLSVPREGHYVRLKLDDDIELYPRARFDNRGSQMTGKSLTAVFLGSPRDIEEEMEHDTQWTKQVVRSALILVEDLGDYYERVGICEITLEACRANTQHVWHDLSPRNLRNWVRKLPEPRRIRLSHLSCNFLLPNAIQHFYPTIHSLDPAICPSTSEPGLLPQADHIQGEFEDAPKFCRRVDCLLLSEGDEDERAHQQIDLVNKIREVLDKYNHALFPYSQINALPAARTSNTYNLRTWLNSPSFKYLPIAGPGADTWGKLAVDPQMMTSSFYRRFLSFWTPKESFKDDLIVPQPVYETDGITFWVTNQLLPSLEYVRSFLTKRKWGLKQWIFHLLQEKRVEAMVEGERRAEERRGLRGGIGRYRPGRPICLISFMITVIACLLPTVAIVVLATVHTTKELLGLIALFTALFSMGLFVFSDQGTSSTQVFTATVAFTAIMVVFVQNQNGSTGFAPTPIGVTVNSTWQ
ncbi:HET-domain-containing protein [Hyaloscypha variabilis F]|uniref:HET-domain-containing protein n=1 Tax=Hyaloscypha variabilis (strain UAMH 11265 / GT02V1 / F) TaxID=1149755 RepID=A0A2J6RJR9_HYAVF|nr:HET-domain-containing protein [Hyaloscypha variabilis F]